MKNKNYCSAIDLNIKDYREAAPSHALPGFFHTAPPSARSAACSGFKSTFTATGATARAPVNGRTRFISAEPVSKAWTMSNGSLRWLAAGACGQLAHRHAPTIKRHEQKAMHITSKDRCAAKSEQVSSNTTQRAPCHNMSSRRAVQLSLCLPVDSMIEQARKSHMRHS